MKTTPDFSFDVFLSHNSVDKARVRRLAERLRAEGLRVWYDEWVIKPWTKIDPAIERGLEAARALVLCLSPEALGSNWVRLERSTVPFRDPPTPAVASSRSCWSTAPSRTPSGATSMWTFGRRPRRPLRNC